MHSTCAGFDARMQPVTRRSFRSSADSLAGKPGGLPARCRPGPAKRCRQDWEIPKSLATRDTGESEARATRTTSSRNALGNVFGLSHVLPAETHASTNQMSPSVQQTITRSLEDAERNFEFTE